MNGSDFDLVKARKDTPGCQDLIHFNNAGSSLSPNPVLEGTIDYLKSEALMGGYETAELYKTQHEQLYQSIATLINAHYLEIAIVESATRAWDLAISSIDFKKGDRVLITQTEYISNYLALLQIQKKTAIKIEFIPLDLKGQVSLEALAEMADEKVKLIAITHVPSTNGMVNPLTGISAIAKSVEAFFLLDACQSIGQMPIDVEKIGCDFLAATGRKFLRAPRGSGFLYVRSGTLKKYNLEPLFIDSDSAVLNFKGSYDLVHSAKRFQNFEMSYASRIGLGIAVDYALAIGLDKIESRIHYLASHLRLKLAEFKNITLLDTGLVQSGIVTFSMKNGDSKQFATLMKAKRINLSTTDKEFAIDLRERNIDSIIRASLHYYNSIEEILKFTEEMEKLLG